MFRIPLGNHYRMYYSKMREYTKKGENMVPRKWGTRHQEHPSFWDGGNAQGIEAPQSGGDVRKPQRGLSS